MAFARADTQSWSVAVVGDGGLTAGLALEALNNVRATETGPLLVVLNDNQMSVSPNVGALPQIFASERAGEFFDLFGFDYIGPVDGNNLTALIRTLQSIRARGQGRPSCFMRSLKRQRLCAGGRKSCPLSRGKPHARKNSGQTSKPKQRSYSEAFGAALCELAERDPKIVVITAAMPEGTGLTEFARRFPERLFDVGIAEPHAVTFAAGLATQGYKPVVAIYSTFLQRGLDGIIHDVALQRLGVTFAIDRAGLVGADGPTHHGMFDLVYLGMIPNLHVSAPASLSSWERSSGAPSDLGSLGRFGILAEEVLRLWPPRHSTAFAGLSG